MSSCDSNTSILPLLIALCRSFSPNPFISSLSVSIGENSTYILHTHNYKLDGHEVKISRHFECYLFTVEVRGMDSHDIMYVCRFL